MFYKEITKTCEYEWINTIHIVFPNASLVIQQFIQRIFAQSIHNILEVLLRTVEEGDTTAVYLQVLASTHRETERLVKELSEFDEREIAPRCDDAAPVLNIILERALDDLFVSYLEGDRYFDLECKVWREDVVPSGLMEFHTFLADRELGTLGRSSTAAKPARRTSTVVQVLIGGEEALTGDEAGIPTLETFSWILRRNVEAVFRCRQLIPAAML
jgi:hypothetical protein